MAKIVSFKNVKVSYSSLKNAEDKCPYGRLFKVVVPMDSPEFNELITQYKELNEKAKAFYSEQEGKKIKNAKSTDDKFQESTREGEEGMCPLSFNIVYVREREIKDENGKLVGKEKYNKTNELYKDGLNCYKLNNNGTKEYTGQGPNGEYQWLPLSNNIINLDVSLVAKYSAKNTQPIIEVFAEKVEIIHSEQGSKSQSAQNSVKLTLDDDTAVNTREEVKQETATTVQETELFTSEELSELDVANI